MSKQLHDWIEQRNKLFEKEPDEIDPTLRQCPMCDEFRRDVETRNVNEWDQYSCHDCFDKSSRFWESIMSDRERAAVITHDNGVEEIVVGTHAQLLEVWSKSPESAIEMEFIK